jgi:hypothetical protein
VYRYHPLLLLVGGLFVKMWDHRRSKSAQSSRPLFILIVKRRVVVIEG